VRKYSTGYYDYWGAEYLTGEILEVACSCYKTSYLNVEFNGTEPSPSVSIPCSDILHI
jgi:hypothetical protein